MLKLGKAPENIRIVLLDASGDEPEAFVELAPITSAMRRRAYRVARREAGAEGLQDPSEVELDLLIDLGEISSLELVRLGLVAWGGIGNEDGEPIELTPDRETRFRTAAHEDRPKGTIDDLLADENIAAILDAKYVRPDALRRAEKNALSALPSGIGKAATPAKGTASSAARPKRKAAAKRAPTAKTSSKRKPAKVPGRS